MAEGRPPTTVPAAAALIRSLIAEHLGVQPSAVADAVRFRDLGVESAAALDVLAALSRAVGRPLPPTAWWRHSTVASMARYLVEGESAAVHDSSMPPVDGICHPADGIAIIGMGCRLPGGIEGPEALWRALLEGLDGVSEVPSDRWDIDAWYDPDPTAPGRMSTRFGGFVDGVDRFDAAFFGISPREAAFVDPQQRFALEVAWAALEDAGIVPSTLGGSATGVYMGAMWQGQYARATGAGPADAGPHTATGADNSLISARVAYALGLRGPALTVDTACSSSAVAVHLAAAGLRDGEADLALAGGVNLLLAPDATVEMTRFGAMNPAGRCRAFDADAAGYVRGEGCGVVVLARLADALAAGRRIYAVLRGSAVNNDGASNGLTAPDVDAQIAVSRRAWARAGRPPGAVAYVETHGPGTLLGDPIEAMALGAAFGPGREAPLALGSIKTNLGHLEAAAGVAGLQKAALAVHRGGLPANLHFERPNPHIDFDGLGLRVLDRARPWPPGPRRAGVNSFGFGGTNAHLALEEAPGRPLRITALAADDADALRALAEALAARADEAMTDDALDRVATRLHGRGRLRATASGRDGHALSAALRAIAGAEPAGGPGRTVFVFGGQGGQWAGMVRDLLLGVPAFRRALDACDRAIAAHRPAGEGRSIVATLAAADELPTASDAVQPLVFAVQVALARTLIAWGWTPDAVVGQSMGEVAAAVVAGGLSLADGARVIVARSRLVAERGDGGGGLAVIESSEDGCGDAIAERLGHLPKIELAGHLAPGHLLIGGPAAALDAAVARLEAEGHRASRVAAAYASHTSAMDPLLPALGEALAGLEARAPTIRMWSTARDGWIDGPLDAAYWQDNLRRPVQVRRAIEALADEGFDAFVEVGPHPVLVRPLRRTLAARPGPDADGVQATCWRGEPAGDGLRALVARAWTAGAAIDWDRVAGRTDAADDDPPPLLISARTRAALRAQAARWARWLDAPPSTAWARVARSAALHRTHMRWRAAVEAADASTARGALAALAGGERHPALHLGDGRARAGVVFVFPGQGGQWAGMGRALLADCPVFAARVGACDAALAPHVGYSVRDVLADRPGAPALARVDVVQPALFAMAVGLAALWRSLGVEPTAVIGHSQGEIAAAVVAGALSLEEGARVVAARARLVRRLSGGAMAFVESSPAEIEARLGPALSLAAVNGPRAVVVAGDAEAVEQLVARLSAEGTFARRVEVDYAAHSPAVAPALPALRAALAEVRGGAGDVPLISSVTGAPVGPGALDADYWCRNLRQPVRFDRALAAAVEQGAQVFVEVSPHPILSASLAAAGEAPVVVRTLERRADPRTALRAGLLRLHLAGLDVDWAAWLDAPAEPPADLPTYAFERRRHWLEVGRPPPPETAAPPPPPGGPPMTARPDARGRIAEALTDAISEVSGLGRADLDPTRSLIRLGIDSLMIVQIRDAMRRRFGVELPNAMFFDPQTSPSVVVDAIASRLPPPAAETRSPSAPIPEADGVARLMAEQIRAFEELTRRQLETLSRLRGAPDAAEPAADEIVESDRPVAFVPYRPLRIEPDAAPSAPSPAVRALIDDYCARTAKTKALTQADRFVFANFRNIRGFHPERKELVYQTIAEQAEGAHLRDPDGNDYLDLSMGFGSALLGHRHPLLTQAIEAQLGRSWAVGPLSPLGGEVAARIAAMTGLPRVAFFNSGTEAVMVALRLARTATGRRKVVVFAGAYHGMFDGVLAVGTGAPDGRAEPMAPGIPPSMVEDTLVLAYDDPAALATIERRADELAAVLAEPVQSRRPDLQPRAFLHALRALTAERGIALVFDEVVTGFRVAPGGAQQWFGVRADLAAYGKIIGGGMPIGAVAGEARFMDGLDGGMWRYGDASYPAATTTFVAGTFCAFPPTMAAARALLDHLAAAGPALQRELNARTRRLCARLNTALADLGLPMHVVCFGSAFRIEQPPGHELFYYRLLALGLYVFEGRTCMLSTAHDDADLDRIVAAVDDAGRWLIAQGEVQAQAVDGYGLPTGPATPLQRAMFDRSRTPDGERACHVPVAFTVDGALDPVRLEAAFTEVVRRHASLRTAFVLDGDTLLRREHPVGDFELVDGPLDAADLDAFLARLTRPFDLSRPGPIRIAVGRLGPERSLLAIDAHHAAVDGASLDVIIEDLLAVYAHRPPPEPTAPFSAFVEAQASPPGAADLAFWRAMHPDPPRTVRPAADRPAADYRRFAVDRVVFDPLDGEALRRAARAQGVTPAVLLHAVFQVFAAHLGRTADVCFGMSVSGRTDARFARTVGLLIDGVAYRGRVDEGAPFPALLAETQRLMPRVLEARGRRLEHIVDGRPTDGGPGFGLGFNYEIGRARGPLEAAGLKLTPHPVELVGASMDLVLELLDCGPTVDGHLAFNPTRYRRETAQRWAARFHRLATALIADPDRPIPAAPPEEHR